MGNPDPINAWQPPKRRGAAETMGDMTKPAFTVRKYGATVPISRDTAIEHGLAQPTQAERQDRERWHAEYETRKRAATLAWSLFVADLVMVEDPVGRAVLNLHKADDDGRCRGCEFDGYEAEPPTWPCQTTTTVAAALGIHVSEDLHMAEQASQW